MLDFEDERLPPGTRRLRQWFGPRWDIRSEKGGLLNRGFERDRQRMSYERHKQAWEDLAKLDPYWAVLTQPRGRFGRWGLEEFFSTGEREVERVMETGVRLRFPSGRDSALDFGCGVGRLTRALARHFQDSCGLDISETMIEKARQLNTSLSNCRFIVNTRDDLRLFPDDRFDMIYSNWVLQHLPRRSSIKSYVSEFVRVLKPGGLLFFQLRTRLSLAAWLAPRRRLYGAMRRLGVSESFLYNRLRLNPMRLTSIPEREVQNLLTVIGANVLEVERYSVASGPGARFFVTKKGAGVRSVTLPPSYAGGQ